MIDSYLEAPPARMHLTDISCCIGQGSRVKRALVANPSHPLML